MRRLVLGLVIATGALGTAGHSGAAAAPVSVVAPFAGEDALLQPSHCRRWLPHRHSGAKPHGVGFGCGKTAAKRTKRT